MKTRLDAPPGLTPEVHEVADSLVTTLGQDLQALLWHGSWARGEQTTESDHDLIVVVKRLDDDILMRLRALFAGRSRWSIYLKTAEELRQYPLTGRLQFHHGFKTLYGTVEPPRLLQEGLLEDLRRLAVDIQHECRYRLIHGSRKIDSGLAAEFVRLRNARWMYYQAKLAVLAMKAREVYAGRSYPATRAELRDRLSDANEVWVLDVVDRWPEWRGRVEEDSAPLALRVDAFARKLVHELDEGPAVAP
jgi:hypothetical protein